MAVIPRSFLKTTLLKVVSRLTGRHAVLLPAEASRDDSILDVRTVYRVDGPRLTVDLLEPAPGRLRARLLGYEGHFPVKLVWEAPPAAYEGPCPLTLDLADGRVCLAGREWGRVPLPLPGRRFCWRLELDAASGARRSRLTGHYLPADGREVGADYFQGDNYVDHDAQSVGDHPAILDLLRAHGARGPVLEVGCATGGLLAALDAAGLPSFGLDISAWAVEEAGRRLGPGRAWVCDLNRDPIPAPVVERGPFGTLLLWFVFEHFARPFEVLAKLAPLAAPGTTLVIGTTNADSLTRWLFGPQWEGYFDWTHLGVDQVGVRSLREELPRLGWQVRSLTTHLVWDTNADPSHATLREWWAADARFRRLLAERDLGDLITCVAVRQP